MFLKKKIVEKIKSVDTNYFLMLFFRTTFFKIYFLKFNLYRVCSDVLLLCSYYQISCIFKNRLKLFSILYL